MTRQPLRLMLRCIQYGLLCWLALAALPARASAQATCTRGLHASWTFEAGVPLNAAAALAESGDVTVATLGGTLHTLSAEGAFRWSYSVAGGLLSGVHAAPGRRLLGISSARQAYAWIGDGSLAWSLPVPVVPSRVVVSQPRQLVFFVTGKQFYAMTVRGSLSWGIDLGAQVASNIAVDPQGSAWFVTSDGRLHRVRTPFFHDKWSLPKGAGGGSRAAELEPKSPPAVISALESGAVVLRDGLLQLVEAGGKVRWSRDAVSAATAAQGTVVALTHDLRAEWLALTTGKPEASIALQALGSFSLDSSLAATRELLFVGEPEGRLWVFNRRGQSASCTVSFASVNTPVFDAKRRQIVATAGDGSVMGIGFDGDW